MAKKLKILSAALMAGAVIVPVAYVHASNVEITVNVAAVAEIARVEEKPTDLGGKEYVVTVKTNSIKGYDLYASADGENWEVVTRDGFGDKYNYGALRFLTTEEGMYITTGNPFFGGQLYLLSNDKAQPGKTVLLGDVNGDGEVSVFDAIAMQKYLADKPVAVFIEEAADVNGDGVIDTNDAIQIQKYTSGKTVKYPIGEPING
jgi:hypothetical protein